MVDGTRDERLAKIVKKICDDIGPMVRQLVELHLEDFDNDEDEYDYFSVDEK